LAQPPAIGASLSAFMTGFVVSRAGYHAGSHARRVAAIALAVFCRACLRLNRKRASHGRHETVPQVATSEAAKQATPGDNLLAALW